MYLKLVPKLGFYSTNKVIVQIEDKKQAKKKSKVSLNNKVRAGKHPYFMQLKIHRIFKN